jgi:DHA2 family multidrug resistance protein-like MFS transporter
MPAGLPPSASAEAGQTLAGAVTTAAQLPPSQGDAVLAAGRQAYTSAMHGASLAAAAVLVLAATIAVTVLRATMPKTDSSAIDDEVPAR